MYDSIPTILTPRELLDKALGRAHKIQKEDRESFWRVKKTILARVESSADTLVDTLDRFIATFPNLDRVTTYERELIDVVLGVLPLKRALARVQGATETIRTLSQDALANVRRVRDDKQPVLEAHRRFVGRASSVVGDLEKPLAFLAHARAVFHRIPDLTPDDPTVVLAGYPNVGKSSLLARLTKARPDIAPYPFTTKQINLGHFAWPEGAGHRGRRYQLVDTPGLLEKPPSERNTIERQAALALAFLGDLIVFVVDPSEACGYTLAQQEKLLGSVRREFAGVPLLVVDTKSDLRLRDGADLAVSATTGKGLNDLKRRIVDAIPKDAYAGVFEETVEG